MLLKRIVIALSLVLIVNGSARAFSGAEGSIPDMETLRALKSFMSRFGVMVAGIELARAKEKTMDWEAIQISVEDMNQIFKELKGADKQRLYKPYFDELAVRLKEVSAKARKKDAAFYESFDKLTDTCFRCHAAHRPNDFLMPKGKRLGQRP